MSSHLPKRRRGAVLTTLLLGLALTACGPQPSPEVADRTVDGAAGEKVYKYDGSVQCSGSGTPVDAMARELTNNGIDVLCGQKGHDGNFYCQACGCGTGYINVYTIRPQNLPDAESLGFAPVSDLSGYQDEPCNP